MKTREGKVIVYWVSYLEGLQRVLLFTQDERIAYYTYSKIDSEKSNMELFLSIKGVGLSLVRIIIIIIPVILYIVHTFSRFFY